MWWSIEQLVLMQPARKFILFAHIWTGCDYTSAIHNQGKLKILNSLKLKEVQHLAQKSMQPMQNKMRLDLPAYS